MDLGISGRRAAVAAASDGLGLASARALGRDGVQLAICGRDVERLEAAVSSLRADGIDVTGLRADVSTTDGAASFVEEAAAALGGPLDIVVPNCGGPPNGGFGSTGLDDHRAALEANLLSTVAMCQAAVPAMRERGWGRIVAITSISARQPIDGLILSNTARAGLTGFLKTLALEAAPDGVTVNSVQPGSHATARLRQRLGDDLTAAAAAVPVKVLGRPDDFGAVVAFLCSDQARFITGTAVPVDGGAHRALQ
jgi:3-oxoacyl-[acyl-carrier protein] reductase